MFNSPGNHCVARDSNAVRVGNHDRAFEEATFLYPRCAGHFAVAIQAETAGVNRIVERIVPARNDCGNAGAHRAFAGFEFSVATDQCRVAHLDTRHVSDRVQFARRTVKRHIEIAGANNFDRAELLYRSR